jgi:hypothetical protein
MTDDQRELWPEEWQCYIPSLREKLQAGLDSLEAGRWVDGETFMDELVRELTEEVESIPDFE